MSLSKLHPISQFCLKSAAADMTVMCPRWPHIKQNYRDTSPLFSAFSLLLNWLHALVCIHSLCACMFPTLECMWKQSSSWRCLHPCVFVHELVFLRVVFLDLDECVEQTHLCQQACENTLGSYRCRCNPGFQLSPDRTSCFSEWITVWCGAYNMITYFPFLFNRAKKIMFLRRSSKSSLFLSYETGNIEGFLKCFCVCGFWF